MYFLRKHPSYSLASLILLIANFLVNTPSVTAEPVVTVSSPSVQDIMAGENLNFAGAVSGGRSGQKIRVEKFAKGKWTYFAGGKLRGEAKFQIVKRVTQAGKFKFRLVYSSAGGGPVFSTALSASVRRWYYLSDLDTVEGWLDSGSASVNGTRYANSVSTKFNGTSAQYNLQRKCIVLEATVGLSDYSESGLTRDLVLLLDQAEGPRYTLSLGQSIKVKFSLRGGLRLGLDLPSDNTRAYAVLGNARIACLPFT